ncbi:MAG: exodeoxyribonuclease VII large subunit [Pirellulales bacterium]
MAYSRSTPPPADQVLSVGQFTEQIKSLLEQCFGSVWISGEISNFSRPQSGHCYLTLKDDEAQLKAVIWRSSAVRIPFDLHDGLEVLCRGRIDLYPPRGTYQLVVDQVVPRGLGALELALRQLREKLAREGLFDPARKRPLPRFPRRVAFVTSPTGAAVRDFLEVLARRWPGTSVLVVPTRVQGEGAAQEIAQAIAAANQLRPPVDVLVVGRGGGSLEDLWEFNEEPVVRAIYASRAPVVSAVGHEIDVTLADLVADVRALTPSEAAELITPSVDELQAALAACRRRLERGLLGRLEFSRARLAGLAARPALRRPWDRLRQVSQRLDELAVRAARAVRRGTVLKRHTLSAWAGKLESLSPIAVLGRGYSLTTTSDGQLVRSLRQVALGQLLLTRLADGELQSRVEALPEAEPAPETAADES